MYLEGTGRSIFRIAVADGLPRHGLEEEVLIDIGRDRVVVMAGGRVCIAVNATQHRPIRPA
jgi:hypothetical protein